MANTHRLPDPITNPANRYGVLLAVVSINVLLYSILDKHQVIRWLMDLSVLAILAGALRALPGRRRRQYVILCLGAAAAISGGLGGTIGIDLAYPIGAGLRGVFLGALLAMILMDISTRREVTLDVVLGACCVYALLGLAWGATYAFLDYVDPSSFQFVARNAVSTGRPDEAALIYFSLITLTTVGYGDLAPISPPARMLAALEALVAQLYLAIVIARFVAMEITSRRDERGRGQ